MGKRGWKGGRGKSRGGRPPGGGGVPRHGEGPRADAAPVTIERLDDTRWRIPKHGGMRVDGIVYADDRLMASIQQDQALRQVANVAHLPGIVGASLAMPDIHWGYGFPIGGVAAVEPGDSGGGTPGWLRVCRR